jgi:hypothetical protein
VIAIACFQAMKAKGIRAEFSEATCIGLCMFTLCQAYLSGIPIVVVVRDIPKAFYLVLTFLILLLCMTILLLLFLPKILLQRKYTGMTQRDQKALMAVKLRRSIVGSSPRSPADSSMQNGDSSRALNPTNSQRKRPMPSVSYDDSVGENVDENVDFVSAELKVKMSETCSEKYLSKNLIPTEMPLEDPSSMLEPSPEDHSNQTQTISA